jgi:DNA primase large subunit
MMQHLIDSLEQGKDIGHYGRLVFAMVARHFLSEEELCAMLEKDQDFSREQAELLLRQVEGKDYNPPKRDRILAWQKEQEFTICPNAEDPDACNVYKDLTFPDHVYEHIQHYQEKKQEAVS